MHCLGFLKRHTNSVFLVLILFGLCRTQQKTYQVHAENPFEKMLPARIRAQKVND